MAEKRILELEATRDFSRTWLHVDMDAFYAAVETLSNPSLKGKPMAVGGMSMISTANYEVWNAYCNLSIFDWSMYSSMFFWAFSILGLIF